MEKTGYYCEECVEEIPDKDVFWEGERAYCGQCGSELDMDSVRSDLVDQITSGRDVQPISTDFDDGEEEEDAEELGFSDAFAQERGD